MLSLYLSWQNLPSCFLVYLRYNDHIFKQLPNRTICWWHFYRVTKDRHKMYDAVLLKFSSTSVLSAYVSVVTYVHLSWKLRNKAIGDFFIRNFGFWIGISHFAEICETTLSKRATFIMSLFSYKPSFCLIFFFEVFYSASSAIKSHARDNLNLEKRRENIL